MSFSVIPLYLVVMILHFTITPLSNYQILLFTLSTVLFMLGLALFNLGVTLSVERMGNLIGREFTLRQSIPLVVIVGFLIGFVVTFADPQVSVLAQQVFDASAGLIPQNLLRMVVSLGCGGFILIGLLRVYYNIPLSKVLIAAYGTVAVLGFILLNRNPSFFSVAMDAGGVTTGPLTIPFVLSMGVGVSELAASKDNQENSFGYVALALAGPIITVMALGILYPFDASAAEYVVTQVHEGSVWLQIGSILIQEIKNITIAIAPLLIIFLVFNAIYLKIKTRELRNILVGLIYVYFGVALFLTGVNGGFSRIAMFLGESLAHISTFYLLLIGFILGLIVVFAEPGVWVLNRNIEEVSGGSIPSRIMMVSLSLAVGIAITVSLLRIVLGFPFWSVLIIIYGLGFLLMLKSPPLFTAIAFDSGSVATGPMTATFLISFAIGATIAYQGNVLIDAFGLVAVVATIPIIVVQIVGWLASKQAQQVEPSDWLESEE